MLCNENKCYGRSHSQKDFVSLFAAILALRFDWWRVSNTRYDGVDRRESEMLEDSKDEREARAQSQAREDLPGPAQVVRVLSYR